MKTVTVSVDEETYRRARFKAAQEGASIAALVRRFLTEIGGKDSGAERLRREEQTIADTITEDLNHGQEIAGVRVVDPFR